jgi:membrane fusion protein (multidrug efflux system)
MPVNRMISRRPAALAISIAMIVGCAKHAPPPPPPAQVRFVTAEPQSVTLTTDLPGRTTAYRIAEIRPQVSGVILKRLFVEGHDVKAGEQLYQIDPAPYQASVDSARATLEKAQAAVAAASALTVRYKPLSEARAVSRQDYDNAVSSEAQAKADVASAKASLETARINLTYTKVLSPITGRTGRSSVTEGALVTANQTNSLVVVQRLDPIYVDVVQPSALLLRLKRELASGKLLKVGQNQAQVKLRLEDDTVYPQAGKLQFAEVSVDQGTGSVTLRAEFPNPEGTLLPGMFVHEQIEEGVDESALLVPQQGVTHDFRGNPTVMVLTANNQAESRVVKTSRAMGDQWLVSDGIAAGDRIIVQGQQSIKPGIALDAKPITLQELRQPASTPKPSQAP